MGTSIPHPSFLPPFLLLLECTRDWESAENKWREREDGPLSHPKVSLSIVEEQGCHNNRSFVKGSLLRSPYSLLIVRKAHKMRMINRANKNLKSESTFSLWSSFSLSIPSPPSPPPTHSLIPSLEVRECAKREGRRLRIVFITKGRRECRRVRVREKVRRQYNDELDFGL